MSILEDLTEQAIKALLDPPSGSAAVNTIISTGKIHMAALMGLLRHTGSQEALDAGYALVDAHFDLLKEEVYEAMALLARERNLNARGDNSTNDATREEILNELHQQENNNV